MSDELHILPPSDELELYLAEFAQRHSVDEIAKCLADARELRVLTVGETIIDEYQYVESIGKSGKEPVLAARYLQTEKFAGGILAVANHAAAVAGSVEIVTVLGTRDSHEQFVRASLHQHIRPGFLYLDDAPTIVKRRFVEAYPLQKLFELYVMNGADDEARIQPALCEALEEAITRADVVVVADYGHGMLGAEAVELLCASAPFLAVNTQVNADNRGFNAISKYRRADFVSLSESELRLEVRNRRREIGEIAAEVAEQLHCPRMIVTRGAHGIAAHDAEAGLIEIPGFAGRIVDRIGAGDAVLAVGALVAATGAPMEIVAMIGNAVGAQAVGMVGNSASVNPAAVLETLESLLTAYA